MKKHVAPSCDRFRILTRARLHASAAVASVALLLLTARSAAELADVYLKSGLRLRGDVSTTAEEVIVRNAAGEVRLPRADVERIVPVEAASQPATDEAPVAGRPTTGPEADTRPSRTGRQATQPAPQPELPPAPPLSLEDIQRLKLLELRLDGPAEPVRVRFLRKSRQRDLPLEVLDGLRERPDFQQEWADTLTRGRPEEKLQLIVRLTGTQHADRIVIESDPEAFEVFRRRVLPLVQRSCARSGCHAGATARVFRFPLGSPSSETYAYSTFALLDRIQTRHGPLLDRAAPEDSPLLSYMLPQENNPRPHPPVERGPTYKAVLRKGDRGYEAVLGWLNSLMTPRPEYGLRPGSEAGEQGPGRPDP